MIGLVINEYILGIIIVIVSFLSFFILIGFVLHSFIFGRVNKRIESIEDVRGKYLEKYYPEIEKGKKWINEHTKEDVFIESFDKLKLHGTFIDNKKAVCLILCHGYHSYGEFDFSCIAEYYYKQGYKMLIIDERAHWKSEGKYTTFGILESKDLFSWIKYIDNRYCKNIKILIDGISMGASTALYVTGMDLPKSVKGVIADCGFTSPYNIIEYTIKTKYHLPAKPLISYINFAAYVRTGVRLNKHTTMDALKECDIPVMFLHGTDDTTVPYEMTIENYNAVRSEKNLHLVERAEHGVSYLEDKEVCTQKLQNFINNCLN